MHQSKKDLIKSRIKEICIRKKLKDERDEFQRALYGCSSAQLNVARRYENVKGASDFDRKQARIFYGKAIKGTSDAQDRLEIKEFNKRVFSLIKMLYSEIEKETGCPIDLKEKMHSAKISLSG